MAQFTAVFDCHHQHICEAIEVDYFRQLKTISGSEIGICIV